MRSMAFTAILAAVLVSAPMATAFARGGHDHAGGGHERSHSREASQGLGENDNTGSQLPISGQPRSACMPGHAAWYCAPTSR